MAVEPVPDAPAAVIDYSDARGLVVADVHAGIEAGLRRDGVELADRAAERRAAILELLERTETDHLFVLGDLGHAIGTPPRQEREEITALVDAITERVPLTLLKGNHDGEIESVLDDDDRVTVTDGRGRRIGNVGLAHGHTWPSRDVLEAETVCVGHEHPIARLSDAIGGGHKERVWLRGHLDPSPFEGQYDESPPVIDGELVVFPAFNDRSGGTWVNAGQSFLSPFLPNGLADGEAYLLDGTRLGPYETV
ncbi:MAG: metallophosphoesterase [Halorhabdus sp.]